MSDMASGFWARRKAAVAAEAEADARATEAALIAEDQAAQAELSDEDILAELGLPDPDTLSKGDDFSGFMAKAVPEHLRKRALRKLWRSNPVLACLDGLNDYDEDFLTGSTGTGPLATTYQVGKGLLAHVEAMAKDTASDPTETPSDLPTEHEPESVEVVAVADVPAPVPEPAAVEVEGQDEDTQASRPRRMTFRFEGAEA